MSNRTEAELEIAQCHVGDGERRLIRVAAMIDAIDNDKYPKATAMGKVLLETMSNSLDIWKLHLLRIKASVG